MKKSPNSYREAFSRRPLFDRNFQPLIGPKGPKESRRLRFWVGLDFSGTESTYQICCFSHAGGQAWVGSSRDAATG